MSNTYHKVKSPFTIKLYSKGKNVGKLPIVTLQIFSWHLDMVKHVHQWTQCLNSLISAYYLSLMSPNTSQETTEQPKRGGLVHSDQQEMHLRAWLVTL